MRTITCIGRRLIKVSTASNFLKKTSSTQAVLPISWPMVPLASPFQYLCPCPNFPEASQHDWCFAAVASTICSLFSMGVRWTAFPARQGYPSLPRSQHEFRTCTMLVLLCSGQSFLFEELSYPLQVALISAHLAISTHFAPAPWSIFHPLFRVLNF